MTHTCAHMLNQAEWFHICLDICYKKSPALNTTGLLLYHYRATKGRQLADFCFSDFGFLWNKGIAIKMAGHRKKRKKMWVVPQIKRWEHIFGRGNPCHFSVLQGLHGSRDLTNSRVCLCLWARRERRWPCSAAT